MNKRMNKWMQVGISAGTIVMVLGLAASVARATLVTGPVILIDDQFNDGGYSNGTDPKDAQWYFYNNNPAGTAWDTTTDNNTPLSGTAMRNNGGTAGNTIAVAQWNPVTLGANDQFIQVSFDLRYGGVPTSGALIVTLRDSDGTRLSGNEFPGAFSLGNDEGYVISKSNTGTGFTYQEFLNNVVVNSSGQTDTISLANTTPHHVVFRVTRVATGLQLDSEIDGIALPSYTDTTPVTYTFDTLSLFDNAGAPRFDNFLVSTVPEPSSLLLLAAGGALLWRWRAGRKAES